MQFERELELDAFALGGIARTDDDAPSLRFRLFAVAVHQVGV